MHTNPSLVAEITLYGTPKYGAGWLARTKEGKLLGTGTIERDTTYSQAIWQAVDSLRERGVNRGPIWIFDAGGERFAEVPIQSKVPHYAKLEWRKAC